MTTAIDHTAMSNATASIPHVDRIGPNAIIRTAAVLRARFGTARATTMLAHATGRALDGMPTQMVDESEVRALVHTCLSTLGHRQTQAVLREAVLREAVLREAVLREAGQRTADCLLAHRIPRPVQWLLRILPARLGFVLLTRAMARQHAWTFAGSGSFRVAHTEPPELTIENCPLCRGLHLESPVRDFYASTLERLLAVLVRRDTCVAQVESAASGGTSCRYVVRWA